jgi:hypothetical protein
LSSGLISRRFGEVDLDAALHHSEALNESPTTVLLQRRGRFGGAWQARR